MIADIFDYFCRAQTFSEISDISCRQRSCKYAEWQRFLGGHAMDMLSKYIGSWYEKGEVQLPGLTKWES